jgi:hypothetical protein
VSARSGRKEFIENKEQTFSGGHSPSRGHGGALMRHKYRTSRARVPGHYERPGEFLDVSAAEYSAIFPLLLISDQICGEMHA